MKRSIAVFRRKAADCACWHIMSGGFPLPVCRWNCGRRDTKKMEGAA
ncbi:MAG: hypothetical protein ACLRSD_17570 [Oscillibacter sp.]